MERATPEHRWKDGRRWRIGDDEDVAWIRAGTVIGRGITSGVPPVFEAYATVVLPVAALDGQARHHQVLRVLDEATPSQPWLLGYLATSPDDDVVFPDAPRVTLYAGWGYVVVEADAEQGVRWRADPRGLGRRGPDIVFPADRSWLVTHLWDDDWLCVGGPAALVDRLLAEVGPDARRVPVDADDATPPGHVAL